MNDELQTAGDAGISPHPNDKRKAVILMASSAFIRRPSYDEPSMLDMEGADLSTLNSGKAPLLADHYRSLDSLLGIIEGAWIDGRHAFAVVRFAKTARGEEARELVADGILRNASVGFGYDPGQVDANGIRIIRRWTPYEVSLVTVPANWVCGPVSQDLALAEQAIQRERERQHAAARNQENSAIRAEVAVRSFATVAAPGLASRLSLDPAVVAAALAAEAKAYQAAA
ncbi:hypothetical protein [Falsiroseomonas sp. E2-1-a20]|uniref:hypothetical protein n=1 Tax=Falsiroseomonas sp. E2-1-a20 TaxID=3239300 RepID=UPI003F3EA5D3